MKTVDGWLASSEATRRRSALCTTGMDGLSSVSSTGCSAAPRPPRRSRRTSSHAVWRRAGTYRADRGSVRVWLLTIARNAAIDWRRTKGKRLKREAAIDEAILLVDEIRVEDRVIATLGAERVRAVVATLPPEQREVLSLAFWSGLSQTEIAARTAVPLGTVKSRVRLGMAKLRERLILGSESA